MPRGIRIQFTALRTNAAIKPSDAGRGQLMVYTAQFMQRLLATVSRYPSWEPEVYVRTMTLFNSWQLKNVSTGDGITVAITNNARDNLVSQKYGNREGSGGDRVTTYSRRRGRYYAQWVHGPNRQVPSHKSHGWKNIGEEIERMGGRGKFAAGAQAIINKSLRDFGV